MSHQLTIEPLGETIEVEEGQTILDAALRAGIWLPHACGHGLCGTCKVDVTEGEVDLGDASPFALMDFERDEGKALACCCTLQEDVSIEAEIEEDEDARMIPVRDFSVTVERLVDLTHDVKGVFLKITGGGGIDFQPGQYINLHVPGVARPRAFSIASVPGDGTVVELHVRRVPGGEATTAIHERLKEGDTLRFAGPYGRFFVRKSCTDPMIFLAGGTGLSSPKSMILDLLAEGRTEAITLIHGVRTQKDLYDREVFEALAAEHGNFRYIPALSEEPEGSDWSGARGFVHEVLKETFDGFYGGHQAYLCGPPPMIEAAIRTLMQGRLFEKSIFTEKFLTARDGEEKPRSPVFKRI